MQDADTDDEDAPEALRREIGRLSAERDCLRFLLAEEKKNNRDRDSLLERVRRLEAKLAAAASVVAEMLRPLDNDGLVVVEQEPHV